MPIEDVDYLRKNSTKQSYIFLVDSAQRDRAVFPTPTEYTITFTAPFNNVIGIDIIDASIPRTQYNIDVYNNTLSFMIHDNSFVGHPIDISNLITVTIPPGDYTIQTLLPQLNEVLSSRLVNSQDIMARITAQAVSNPPEITNLIKFTCPYPFVFDMASSTIAETLGFHMFTQSNEAAKPILAQRYISGYVINHGILNRLNRRTEYEKLAGAFAFPVRGTFPKLIVDVLLVGYEANAYNVQKKSALIEACSQEWGVPHMNISITNIQDKAFKNEWTSDYSRPLPAAIVTIAISKNDVNTSMNVNMQLYHSVDILNSDVSVGEINTSFEGPRGIIDKMGLSTVRVAQSFRIPTRTYLYGVEAALSGVGTINWRIYTNTSTVDVYEPGDIVEGAEGDIVIYESDGTLSPAEGVRVVMLEIGTYWIEFTATDDAMEPALYYNDAVGNREFLKVNRGSTQNIWEDVKIGDVVATASIKIITADEYHTIISPGTYNLVGERYIILRCPEIEENSFRSLAYTKYFLGLAMFRMGLVGLSDNPQASSRVHIPMREFHPIGKLSKLTFRFETIDGKPYDFKGVNHTMTLAMYYLEPSATEQFSKSILNPNYNPNVIQYYYTHEEQEGDSDDQDEDYNRDVLTMYKVQESRHLPETVGRLDREALFHAYIEEDADDHA